MYTFIHIPLYIHIHMHTYKRFAHISLPFYSPIILSTLPPFHPSTHTHTHTDMILHTHTYLDNIYGQEGAVAYFNSVAGGGGSDSDAINLDGAVYEE